MKNRPHHRLAPPPWRHDWYPLRALGRCVATCVASLARELPLAPIVVDYGAGDAPYRPLFEAAMPGVQYLECDLGPNCRHPIDDRGRLPLSDASADLVVSFQVLEHVPDVTTYLDECRRVLRPDGSLVLSTHGTWLYHPHPTDYRRWTKDGLVLDIERAGFRVREVHPMMGPLAWTTQFRLFGYRSVLERIPLLGSPLVVLLCLLMNARMVLEDLVTPASLVESNASTYLVVAAKSASAAAADSR